MPPPPTPFRVHPASSLSCAPARRDAPRERSAAMKLRCKMWKKRVDDVSRPMRRAVISAGAAGLMMINGGVALAASDDEGVTAPEDLMKEHGVLNRCLLIYEGAIRRIETKEEIGPEVFQHTGTLVRRFVEEYHEKN